MDSTIQPLNNRPQKCISLMDCIKFSIQKPIWNELVCVAKGNTRISPLHGQVTNVLFNVSNLRLGGLALESMAIVHLVQGNVYGKSDQI